jgi:SulP family sulfate permease
MERSDAEKEILRKKGRAVLVLHLHGYLFFGTAARLLREIRAEIESTSEPVQILILDFRATEGVDSSALASFERLAQVARAARIVLCYSGLVGDAKRRLTTVALPSGTEVQTFQTLDDALQSCEARLLAAIDSQFTTEQSLAERLALEIGCSDRAATVLKYMEAVTFAPGEALTVQGDSSDSLLFIEAGRANATVNYGKTTIRVRSFGPGTMVGEIGFVLRESRTATVRAETESRVLRLTRREAERLMSDDAQAGAAFLSFLTRRLCMRIRDKDHLIETLVRSISHQN